MIPKPDLVKKVKYYFNLNIYESKVWLALLGKSIASVGEIAELSNVPRSRVYDVLESLEKRGFAIAKLGKPIKYIAVKPAVVLEHMKNNIFDEAEEKAKNLLNAREIPEYKELEMLYTQGIKPIRPEELSSAISGRQNIYNHMKELIANAKKEIILVSTIEALNRKKSFLVPLFEKIKLLGVNIKVAASVTDDSKKDIKAKLFTLSKQLGTPVKSIKINSRFFVVDNSEVLIFATPDNGEDKDIAIWVNSPFFSRALTTFLNPVWRN